MLSASIERVVIRRFLGTTVNVFFRFRGALPIVVGHW